MGMTQRAPVHRLPTPEEQRHKSLVLLEFTEVRQRLARHAAWVLGQELVAVLEPAYSIADVQRLGAEAAEARTLLSAGTDLDLREAVDIRPHLERAEKAGMLSGQELWEVAVTLLCIHQSRQALVRRRAVCPLLSEMAAEIPEMDKRAQSITKAIGPNGEVMDHASPELRDLRVEVRVAYHRLEEHLTRMMRSSLAEDALQEQLVTERNGRLVLMVKSGMRHRLPGLVHDTSESGATAFIEPMSAIPLGNRWHEARAAEQREVQRILRELSEEVAEYALETLQAMGVVAYLDLVMAKAKYGAALHALPSPVPVSEDKTAHLVDARHPLLGQYVVPLSIALGPNEAVLQKPVPGWNVLLITGPNAGGKTVSLKTVGLLALMNQAGLQLPVNAGTTLPVFDTVLADIGDQQSIQQSLSSFTSHVTSVQAILRDATGQSLVLLDELGASTDPEEGSALAKAVLEELCDRGVTVIATTHYRDVAAFAQEHPGMMNASVELDPATLSPTYRMSIGLPGRSYALAIASRVGFQPSVLERARAMLPEGTRRLETLLLEVQAERQAAAEARRQAQEASEQAEATKAELEARLADVESERAKLLENAQRDMERRIAELAHQITETEEALKAARASAWLPNVPGAIQQARQTAAQLQEKVTSPEWKPPEPDREAWLATLKAGDAVRIKGFHVDGRIISTSDSRGSAQVQLGGLRMRVQTNQLEPPPGVSTRIAHVIPENSDLARLRRAEVEQEMDIRGKRVDDALREMETFLDQSMLQGLGQVRIIHGTGTGALRQALRDRLSQHPLVRKWVPGDGRQSDGVTLVTLT
ncbi:MAG: endonuclease MutS2 [Dehalococcoidia bacterium]|nr:endonuclease MutS2 [Dehalococcoidia bacterium]